MCFELKPRQISILSFLCFYNSGIQGVKMGLFCFSVSLPWECVDLFILRTSIREPSVYYILNNYFSSICSFFALFCFFRLLIYCDLHIAIDPNHPCFLFVVFRFYYHSWSLVHSRNHAVFITDDLISWCFQRLCFLSSRISFFFFFFFVLSSPWEFSLLLHKFSSSCGNWLCVPCPDRFMTSTSELIWG